jgi:hypothetical protein
MVWSPEGAKAFDSVPKIAFVDLNIVLNQKSAQFFLERFCPMVFRLAPDISLEFRQLTLAEREHTVTSLPAKA